MKIRPGRPDHQNVIHVAYSPNGKYLAYGIGDSKGTDDGPDVGLWEIDSERVVRGFRCSGDRASVGALTFSPDGKLLAAADDQSHLIYVWNTETGKRVHTWDAVPERTRSLAFSPDGTLLATGGGFGAIRIWNVATGNRIAPELEGHESSVAQVAFPAEQPGKLVTAAGDGAVFVWNVATGRPEQVMRHPRWVRGVAVSSDGRLIASSSLDDTVRLWDAATGKEVFRLPGHGRSGGHRPVAFLPGGKRFASFGEDLSLRLWDTETGRAVEEYALRPSGIDVSKFSNAGGASSGFSAGSATDSGEIHVSVHGSTFSPDGQFLVLPWGKDFYVFETATGRELRKLPLDFVTNHLAVSPDNRRLLYCGPEFASDDKKKSIHLCDLKTGKELWSYAFPDEFEEWRSGPGPLAFSPDGRLMAAGVRFTGKDRIYVWDVTTGEELLQIKNVPGVVRPSPLAFSPDNRLLACGQYDSTVLIWDLTRLGLPPPSR